jgi:hypothetical protein
MLFCFSKVNALLDSNHSIEAFAMHHCMDRSSPVKSGLAQRVVDGGYGAAFRAFFWL